MVRFHGRNRAMRERLPRVRELAAEAREVHLLMKTNHGDGAVRKAFQLARLLGLAYREPPAPEPGAPGEPSGRR